MVCPLPISSAGHRGESTPKGFKFSSPSADRQGHALWARRPRMLSPTTRPTLKGSNKGTSSPQCLTPMTSVCDPFRVGLLPGNRSGGVARLLHDAPSGHGTFSSEDFASTRTHVILRTHSRRPAKDVGYNQQAWETCWTLPEALRRGADQVKGSAIQNPRPAETLDILSAPAIILTL